MIIPFPTERVKPVEKSCDNCWYLLLLKGSPYCAAFAEFTTVDHGPDCELHEVDEAAQ